MEKFSMTIVGSRALSSFATADGLKDLFLCEFLAKIYVSGKSMPSRFQILVDRPSELLFREFERLSFEKVPLEKRQCEIWFGVTARALVDIGPYS